MRTNRRPVGPLAASGMVSLWGASSLFRSVQYAGVAANAATINYTCTAVNVNNSVVIPLGLSGSYATASLGVTHYGIYLSSSTNVQVKRQNWSGETVFFAVVEFAPGVLKSAQNASINLGALGGISATTTITAVNTAKTAIISSQTSNGDNSVGENLVVCSVQLTNSTTLTAGRDAASASYYPIAYVTVLEFF